MSKLIESLSLVLLVVLLYCWNSVYRLYGRSIDLLPMPAPSGPMGWPEGWFCDVFLRTWGKLKKRFLVLPGLRALASRLL